MYNIVEIEKEAVGFSVACHLVSGEFTQGGSTLFFIIYLHYSEV